jgi:hypothetical protein
VIAIARVFREYVGFHRLYLRPDLRRTNERNSRQFTADDVFALM